MSVGCGFVVLFSQKIPEKDLEGQMIMKYASILYFSSVHYLIRFFFFSCTHIPKSLLFDGIRACLTMCPKPFASPNDETPSMALSTPIYFGISVV
mmetsp:Transcript_20147/g.43762  ORF Transcript_20147/g.43762 Transcript_20147/m.43762 type:complete len:95 (-) Transcript_20147:1789-2073(-)